MAWNKPDKENSPWNSSGSGELPDLDQLLRNLLRRLGGGRRGGGSKLRPPAYKFLPLIGGGVVVLWLLTGFFLVQPAEKGVVTQFGRYHSEVGAGPHWHIPWPVQSVEKVNVLVNRSIRLLSQSMLTQDENIILIDLSVQYNVKDTPHYLFNVRDPDATLKQVAESAIREVIGTNDMDFIITAGRVAISANTKLLMQEILDRYRSGLTIQEVNLQSAQPPEQVQPAFADAVKAREDEQRYINEAEAYANEVLPRARGDAQIQLEQAQAHVARVTLSAKGEAERFLALWEEYKKAPIVTRDRLYLSAMQAVLGNSKKVFIEMENKNNILYLPLGGTANSAVPQGLPALPESQALERFGEDIRQRSRSRERTR